jgi:hypothetical protein
MSGVPLTAAAICCSLKQSGHFSWMASRDGLRYSPACLEGKAKTMQPYKLCFAKVGASPDDAIVTALIEARNSNSHPAEKKTCDKIRTAFAAVSFVLRRQWPTAWKSIRSRASQNYQCSAAAASGAKVAGSARDNRRGCS